MNKLSNEKRTMIIGGLVEGVGINAISRMASVSKNTVLKLITDLGTACANYQDEKFRNLRLTDIQCDEIWSFCHSKAKNVPEEKKGTLGYGDLWTWVAMDRETKLVPCFHVGRRNAEAAYEFMMDLASRLSNRVQLTTDGHRPYLEAVEAAFGCEIDYAMLVKLYGKSQEEIRYSPADCLGSKKTWISGNPEPKSISTSHIERQNLTMRMSMRRFTRLTNGFSKKMANHIHALAIHYFHYNFVRLHQTIKCTPAMEANVVTFKYDIADMIELMDRHVEAIRLERLEERRRKRISN